MRNCRQCDGTGKVFAARSWFTADGYSLIRCGVCVGTGKSNFQPDPSYAAKQALLRATHH